MTSLSDNTKLLIIFVVATILCLILGAAIELGGFGIVKTLIAAIMVSGFVGWFAFVALLVGNDSDLFGDSEKTNRQRRRERKRKKRAERGNWSAESVSELPVKPPKGSIR